MALADSSTTADSSDEVVIVFTLSSSEITETWDSTAAATPGSRVSTVRAASGCRTPIDSRARSERPNVTTERTTAIASSSAVSMTSERACG